MSRGEAFGLKKNQNNPMLDVEYYNGQNFGLSTEVWVKHFAGPKLCSRGRTLGTITSQKCCHLGSFGGDVRWTLAFSVKAESTDFGHLCIFSGPNASPLEVWP